MAGIWHLFHIRLPGFGCRGRLHADGFRAGLPGGGIAYSRTSRAIGFSRDPRLVRRGRVAALPHPGRELNVNYTFDNSGLSTFHEAGFIASEVLNVNGGRVFGR